MTSIVPSAEPLRRCFTETFGATPQQYVIARRLERAQELLRLTELSVTEISRATGWSQREAFCRAFKRDAGVTPTEFRRVAREQGRGAGRFARRH